MSGRTDIEAANPITGEVLEHLDRQPPESLAEALDAIHTRQAELKRWEGPLDAELRRRLKLLGRKLAVFGAWEVEASSSRESEWDPDELEGAMDRLIGEGIVQARDVIDIVTRRPVVARSKARDLARRLDGDARHLIEACCTWKEKPGKLTVARSVELAPAGERAPSPPEDHLPQESSSGGSTATEPARAPTPVLDREELFK
jgi:hypothetical protein